MTDKIALVTNSEHITLILRTLKLMNVFSENLSFNMNKTGLVLISESRDQSHALIAQFSRSFFDEFYCNASHSGALYVRNMIIVTSPHKSSIVSLRFMLKNKQFIDLLVEYNTGVKAVHGIP